MEKRTKVMNLVQKGVERIKSAGAQRAFNEFDDRSGEFIQGEYYIAAFDMNGIRTAVGLAPARRGDDMKTPANVQWWNELYGIASTKGRGWMDYSHVNPHTGEANWKSSYVERCGDYILCSGFYREQTEVERLFTEATYEALGQPVPGAQTQAAASPYRRSA